MSLYLDRRGDLIHRVVTDEFKLLGNPPPAVTEFEVAKLPPVEPAENMRE